ncbi:hypothetical protein ACQ4PT_030313 [Festuca glaucescens]
MAPHCRPNGARAPAYGQNRNLFSVEFNHGGYFIGQGSNRSYVDGATVWYDHVDSRTWSPTELENLIEEIGYEMQGRMKVHNCIPILTISRNVLRDIREADDTTFMANFVSIGNHFISVYLDHDESIRNMEWDDVVAFPVVELPPVISPAKPTRTESGPSQKSAMNKEHEEEGGEECSLSAEEHDSNYEIVDSDYEIGDDDDDLYADHVEDEEGIAKKKKGMKGEANIEGDGDSEGEDLWAPDSDEEKVELKFKTFRKEDLAASKFFVGQIFEFVDMLRRAIKEYSCQNRRDIRLHIHDKKRTNARCYESSTSHD